MKSKSKTDRPAYLLTKFKYLFHSKRTGSVGTLKQTRRVAGFFSLGNEKKGKINVFVNATEKRFQVKKVYNLLK